MSKKRGVRNKILLAGIILLVLALGLLSASNSGMASITGNSILNWDKIFAIIGGLKNVIKVSGFATYDAQCISNTLPSTMISGETRSVSVTMKNLGDNTWTAANNYKLGPATTADDVWGINRVYMAANAIITKNNQYTFTLNFNIRAPIVSTTTVKSSRWKMLRENVQWFGPTCGKDITITPVAAPVCTPSQTQSQQCGTTDVGECSYGTQTRTCQSNGQWGAYGVCNGAINPVAETCNGKDDDCDNLIDENFDLDHDGFSSCCPQ